MLVSLCNLRRMKRGYRQNKHRVEAPSVTILLQHRIGHCVKYDDVKNDHVTQCSGVAHSCVLKSL